MTDRRPEARRAPAVPSPAAGGSNAEPRGFRPAPRRRARIAAGAAIAAVAVAGNVIIYTSLDDSTEVLQVVRDVRAGEQLTAEDVRAVAVDVDATVPVVDADDAALVIGQYARVHLASGSLVVEQLVQPEPLVVPGMAVVAIAVTPSAIPSGLRERSRVQLVITGPSGDAPAVVVDGRVVARGAEADSISGRFPLSVEVAAADAPALAAADDVRVVLLDPGGDPLALEGG